MTRPPVPNASTEPTPDEEQDAPMNKCAWPDCISMASGGDVCTYHGASDMRRFAEARRVAAQNVCPYGEGGGLMFTSAGRAKMCRDCRGEGTKTT